ncbi:hypothetical protein [Endozoicomonas atrinae]|uniref:hypothetical protein n=1 Tax=Endozoicomonas atrinae TaxID=1333660 RepID=UPI003AFFBCFB
MVLKRGDIVRVTDRNDQLGVIVDSEKRVKILLDDLDYLIIDVGDNRNIKILEKADVTFLRHLEDFDKKNPLSFDMNDKAVQDIMRKFSALKERLITA